MLCNNHASAVVNGSHKREPISIAPHVDRSLTVRKKQVEPINEDVRRVDVSLRHLPNRNVTAA